MFKGHYLLSTKNNPIGANRVDFEIDGDLINVNYSGWRYASLDEIRELLKAAYKTGQVIEIVN